MVVAHFYFLSLLETMTTLWFYYLQSYLVFKQILGDVFMGMHDTSGSRQILQKELEKAILMKADENKLFPHSPWLNKVKQLFSLSLVNSGRHVQQYLLFYKNVFSNICREIVDMCVVNDRHRCQLV